jgi:RNA polymerase sigma factor (sigma-70 family)
METLTTIARVFRWMRRRIRPRESRPGRAARIFLESLEERCVATTVSGPQVVPSTAVYVAQTIRLTIVTMGRGAAQAEEATPWQPASASQPGAGSSPASPTGAAARYAFVAGDWYSRGVSLGPDTAIDWSSSGGTPLGRAVELLAPQMAPPVGAANPPGAAEPPFRIAYFEMRPADAAPGQGGLQVVSPLDQPGKAAELASGSARAADAAHPVFRIARAPTGDGRAEVRYSLAVYSRAGAASREGLAVFPAGAAHADVTYRAMATGHAARPEIVTLTLVGSGTGHGASSSLTVFLPGEARRCSEAALLAAFREEGSAQAFNALVERHRSAVLRSCYRVLGSWHDAEDVSQMVFLALAQGKMRLHTTLSGWLSAVARNAAIVLLRSRRRRQRHELHAARPERATYEEFTAELREEAESALARLSGPLQEAVRLRYLEGWSQAEAAQMLGCPRGTLAQRASMGLQRLRDILGGEVENGHAD